MGWRPVVVQFGIQILILAFTLIPSVYKLTALTKSWLRNASLPAFLWVSAIAEIKIQTEFWFLSVSEWVIAKEENMTSDAWQIVHSTWSKEPGYRYALCLEFTYVYNQEMFGLFVNRPPLLLLYGLPVLKSFHVLWQNKSLSPADPGCPRQSYKS